MATFVAKCRDRAEGGAGGALAPPLPHFFGRIKINLTKTNLTKKFSFTHSSLAPPLENLLRGPWNNSGGVKKKPMIILKEFIFFSF